MVLGPISYHGNASQKVLSDACIKDKTSITRIVNTLEKKNLVVRVDMNVPIRDKKIQYFYKREFKSLFLIDFSELLIFIIFYS